MADHIVEDLENNIAEGTLKPGQRIIEEALCRTFGVSRAPIREAFQILESRGFVVREPRRGVTVVRISPREATDIYRIRASLEGLAILLAVRRRTPDLLRRLRRKHEEMIQAAARENRTLYQQLNRQFHELIIDACGNRRLIRLIGHFNRQTMRYRLAVTSSPGWMASSTHVHEATLSCFETGDAEAAEMIRRSSILDQIKGFGEIFSIEEET